MGVAIKYKPKPNYLQHSEMGAFFVSKKMKSTYKKAMQWVARSEGGYVNHPKDPGGATNHGITQRVYDSYRRRKHAGKTTVRYITADEVAEIYRVQYADQVRYDDLPAGVDYAVLDYAINSGVRRSAKAIQRIVGVRADGVIGNVTLAAIDDKSPSLLVKALCDQRLSFLQRLRNWRYFGRGWSRRVMFVRRNALGLTRL